MQKLRAWLKTEERGITLLKAGLFALLPILCGLMYVGTQGKSIGDVYLPGCEWNDELFILSRWRV